jgi:uncharacterized protein (TIGR03435 family)
MGESAMQCILALVAILCLSTHVSAQTVEPSPKRFEVASVKPSRSTDERSKLSSDNPGRFIATNVPLRFLILHAYHLRDHELVDAPQWTSDEAFDVIGTYAPDERPSDSDIRAMLQNLLEERFGLKLHHAKREIPAYELVVAGKKSLGPWLRPSNVDCAAWLADKRPRTNAGGPSPVTPSGKRSACMMIATRRYIAGGTQTMADLAVTLQAMLGRPIIDKTGLTGGWDMDLKWTPTDLKAGDGASPAAADEGPSLFTAVQEQLGLKLSPLKESVEVLVIDAVNRPTSN